ncbi:MAG: transcriptional coactivator p15/PC4 family protein [Proteobacteria bacterium]|nr:transcriptional coactivator p15/PC4 family protein [Pseudomonadota bacterium]
MSKLIGEVEKNQKERIRVSLAEYQGYLSASQAGKYVDYRVYFRDDKGEWFPTKKGVTFNDEAIDEVIPLLQKASGATPHPNLGNEAGTEGE